MKPPPFDYHDPNTLDDALALLAQHGDDCKVIAGGQSLVPMMNLRVVRPDVLVDINGLPDLDYIRVDGGQVRIGALTRHATLMESNEIAEACPLMAEAYQLVAHGPIRNRGTLAGNLCHADPASEMPAVALATEAEITLRSTRGERTVAAADFFTGALETVVAADELVVEVCVPVAPAGQGWSFQEVSGRKGDFAYVAVGATLLVEGGACQDARIVCAGVGDHAFRAREAEAALTGQAPDDAQFVAAAEIASNAVEPNVDYHADAAYRRDLVKALTRRVLAQAASRCG